MLGPVLERTNDELLDPLIDRVYAQMDRAGLIPPAPEELEGVALKVEYTSILAQAQKLVGVSTVDRFLQSTVPLMETFPEIRHKIKTFAVVDEYAELLGVNPKLVVPDDEAQQAMQADAEARQKQMQLQQLEQSSKAAKNLAGSDLEGDTALKRLLEAAGQ